MTSPYGNYKWPENLYIESMEQANYAFMTYTFSYVLDVARKEEKESRQLKGFQIEQGSYVKNEAQPNRSFTPVELLKVIEDNLDTLRSYHDNIFNEDMFTNENTFISFLKQWAKSCEKCDIPRSMVLEQFDDEFQTRELVYGIVRDSINKRITLTFRGTANYFAFKSNWLTNASIFEKSIEVPKTIKIEDKDIGFHTGFYNYLFDETATESDPSDTTKMDQIKNVLKPILKEYSDHKLYVTGHSLGGGLSTMASYFLCLDPDILKPITNFSFASPRVGDHAFLNAVRFLEKTKQLRIVRVVNENDSITAAPTVGYSHVGFQVRLYAKGWFSQKEPNIEYKSPKFSWWQNKMYAYRNSLLANFNLSYDHGAYRKRIEKGKTKLESKNLNNMYNDPKIVGFKLE